MSILVSHNIKTTDSQHRQLGPSCHSVISHRVTLDPDIHADTNENRPPEQPCRSGTLPRTPAHPNDNDRSCLQNKMCCHATKTDTCDTDPSHPPGLKMPQILIWLGYMWRADPWIPSGSAVWLYITNLWVFHDCLLLHTPNMSFIGKFPLACCCDDMFSVFLQSDDFLNQNPKLNSCLLTETMTQWLDVGLIQYWIQWTMKSSQTMLEEFCSWWFSKVLVTTDGGVFCTAESRTPSQRNSSLKQGKKCES